MGSRPKDPQVEAQASAWCDPRMVSAQSAPQARRTAPDVGAEDEGSLRLLWHNGKFQDARSFLLELQVHLVEVAEQEEPTPTPLGEEVLRETG